MPDDNSTKILFLTQKIHQDDDDLAFVILWIKEFIRQGAEVQVICLEKGKFDDSFPVYSLGKEKGAGKWRRIINFYKYIFTLDYNRVFVHMNPEYVTLGGWWWWLTRRPIYLWYTHYTRHFHLWLSGILCRRMFAATVQSLPQYNHTPKKVVTGHGIDVDFWLKKTEETAEEPQEFKLLTVHRLCRSKRLEIPLLALKKLGSLYNLIVYGREVEKDYVAEIKDLITKEDLAGQVHFTGPVPMAELGQVYPRHRLLLNMAMETIDKTMLEAMLFGLYPVTTPGNSQAIGLPVWPAGETAEDLADFIREGKWRAYDRQYLQAIVKEKHSLPALITKMLGYITKGE